MSVTNTIIEVPELPPAYLLAEIVSYLPIHVLVQAVIGNRFWTEQVLPLIPRLTVTRVNDLDGDSAILKSLKKNVTSLVLRGDNDYKGYKSNGLLYKQIDSFESVVHLRLLKPFTVTEQCPGVKLEDSSQYLLNRMGLQLKCLVMDGVHFLVEEGYPQCDRGPMGCGSGFSQNPKLVIDFSKESLVTDFTKESLYFSQPMGPQLGYFPTPVILMTLFKTLPEEGPTPIHIHIHFNPRGGAFGAPSAATGAFGSPTPAPGMFGGFGASPVPAAGAGGGGLFGSISTALKRKYQGNQPKSIAMSTANTIIQVPELPVHLLAEIVSDLPIHVLVQAVIGNRFWTEEVLPIIPRLTVTRVNDLDGDSAILKSLKKNVTSLVLRGDNNVYKGYEYNALFRQIASFESVVHLRLLNLGTDPAQFHCVQVKDFTKYLLNRMAPQLKSLVMDGVHFLVDKIVDFEVFSDFLKKITNCQQPTPWDFRHGYKIQYFQLRIAGNIGPSTSMLMSFKTLPEMGPGRFALIRMKLIRMKVIPMGYLFSC
jgi:hypothetical protein